ncbi:MAG: hypothetical protein ACREB8_16770 [Pseudolabrys sp.]
MVRRNLSEELKKAGHQLLLATDALDMQAQGAMWVYSQALQDWRYYLVTSLVDSIGRRKTYRLLLNVFERVEFPKDMTIEDIHLGSPNESFFQLVSKVMRVEGGTIASFEDCKFNNVSFNGIVYRAVRSIPSKREAERIEKRFQKKVKDLIDQ